ncbi:MAG: BON domain-containing protein [Legionella sp.]|nr:MAG: BON domain-containing protein [Legionella sp.]
MLRHGRYFILFVILCASLNGCVGGVWTGASMVYDRHHVYKKLEDYRLLVSVTDALMVDNQFKGPDCAIDVAVFNEDVLIVGHLATEELLNEAKRRLAPITGYRRLFNEITVINTPSNSAKDSWITAKIRSSIFADGAIDPNAFKVVTADRVVYLMGDVQKDQAEKVIQIARRISGVERVVKLLKYYTYESK